MPKRSFAERYTCPECDGCILLDAEAAAQSAHSVPVCPWYKALVDADGAQQYVGVQVYADESGRTVLEESDGTDH